MGPPQSNLSIIQNLMQSKIELATSQAQFPDLSESP